MPPRYTNRCPLPARPIALLPIGEHNNTNAASLPADLGAQQLRAQSGGNSKPERTALDHLAALRHLSGLQPRILTLTEELVRINSHSANIEGVNSVGAVLERELSLPGLTMERVPGEGCGDHLFWYSEAARTDKAVFLVGHHDTVFPPGVFDGWNLQGDRVMGPGALDMKGALAMLVTVARCLSELGLLERIPIRIASVADEEVGSRHSRGALLQRSERCRCALVFEAGRAADAVITRRRGTGNALLHAIGRAAHAGNAIQEGSNAIWAAARWVDKVQRITDCAAGISVNVGLIEGGTAANTVPDAARCTADLRFADRAGLQHLRTALAEAAREAAREVPDTKLELDVQITRPPMEASPEGRALCARYLRHAHAAGLGGAEADLIGGGSDANLLAEAGLPVIDGLGPRGQGFHTLDETMERSSLAPKAQALLRFLLDSPEDLHEADAADT